MSADRFVGRRAGQPRVPGRAVALLSLTLGLGGCPWFTDFKEQPSISTWESASGDSVPPRANPMHSVPITGVGVPAFVVSYQPLPATLDSMSGLRNPTPMSEASLANGRMHYQINCAVCHGLAGQGNGPAAAFGMPGFPLTSGLALGRTDGFIYAIIRNGRGLMPNYNRIEDMDRWDVVNYIRALQGAGGFTVDTLPPGRPGQTGDLIPGPTRVAPTRPAPFVPPDSARRDIPTLAPSGSATPGGRQ
ncbi:MAG TPA: cytochrome c [Gemmatimonadaceae bacterium]|nr:cytochrome c [Gemmatimonadaceae bacterium]